MKKALFASVLVSLAACAGGIEDPTPSEDNGPIFGTFDQKIANNPSPLATKANLSYLKTDDFGHTFRAYFAERANGSGAGVSATTSAGFVEFNIVSSTEIVVKDPSGNFVTFKYCCVSPSGNFDVFTRVGKSSQELWIEDFHNYSYRHGLLGDNLTSATGAIPESVSYRYGYMTPVANLPSNGSANYYAVSNANRIYIAEAGFSQAYDVNRGVVDLSVDFTNQKISGTLFDNSAEGDSLDVLVTLTDADITNSDFVGKTTIALTDHLDPSFSVSSSDGQAAGMFTGPAAERVIGSFLGSATTISGSGANSLSYSGIFRANKQ